MQPNYVARKSAMSAVTFGRILSCILIIPIFVLVFRIISAKKYRIEFYDDKIITYSGVISTNKKQSVFMGVTSTSVSQTLFGKIFHYGNVVVDCVGKWDIDTNYIKDPDKLEEYLQTKIVKVSQSNQYIHV